MSSQFDKLDELRSFARARAEEDFEYFANNVLGANYNSEFCSAVQNAVVLGTELHLEDKKRVVVLDAWKAVIEKRKVRSAPSETFKWLFAELVEAA